MGGRESFEQMEEGEDMGWGKMYHAASQQLWGKGAASGFTARGRSVGNEEFAEQRRGMWEGDGGRRIRLEKVGREQGDFSILPDFRTCLLSLTLSTPRGGNQPLSLTKPPPSLLGVAAAPSVEGHRQTCPKGQR